MGLKFEGAVQARTQAAPVAEPLKSATATTTATATITAPAPLPARAEPIKIPMTASAKKLAPLPGYEELRENLEPLIEKQLAEVKQVLLQKGVSPADVKIVYAIDITGSEIQVCLACGQIGHNFRPTMVRQENPEINMLSESLVVFLEVASRLGLSYSVVAYDEEVLPLRELLPPANNQAERAATLSRFDSFRRRHKTPDITDREWMAREMPKWNPADATKKVVGDPNDKRALDTAQALLLKAGDAAVRGVTVSKSQIPKTSLLGFEAMLKGKGIKAAGIAVGANAPAAARAMFQKTDTAQNNHILREKMGKSMSLIVEQAGAK